MPMGDIVTEAEGDGDRVPVLEPAGDRVGDAAPLLVVIVVVVVVF